MGVDVAIAAALIGGAVETASQVEAARVTRREGKRKARELERAAAVERERGRRLRAQQAARFGAAGVSGVTAAAVTNQSVVDSLLDQEAILAGAKNIRRESRARARAFEIGAFSSALGTIGQVYTIQNNDNSPAKTTSAFSGSAYV